MISRPRDLETGEPISNLAAYDAQVRGIVGHYIDQTPAAIPSPTATGNGAPKASETLQEKVARIGIKLACGQQSPAVLAGIMDKPEDPWGSLGAAHYTYYQTGLLPAGSPESDITQHVTRGRGGKLVTRLALGGKFIDVPVEEGSRGSHSDGIQTAKQRLINGKGVPVTRLRSRKK